VPWACDTCCLEISDDQTECPQCAAAKSAWSIAPDVTREFVVARRSFTLHRGTETEPRAKGAKEPVTLEETAEVRAIPKSTAQALLDQNLLPPTADLLFVALHNARADLGVEIEVVYYEQPSDDHEFPRQRSDDDPKDVVPVPFLFVFGPEALEGVAFDGVHVVDVTEAEAAEGCAEEVEFSALGQTAQALPVRLELFVEVELHDADGQPVPGEGFQLLGSGDPIDAELDENGFARVEVPKAEAYKLRFELHADAWKPAEGEDDTGEPEEGEGLTHTVEQGECVSELAARYGLESWTAIHEHAENEALFQKRNPHVLYAGDEVYVPAKTKLVPLTLGERHSFTLLVRRVIPLKLILQDISGEPVADEPCTVTVGEAKIEGTTNADGLLEVEVPHDTRQATLAYRGLTLELNVGALNPTRDVDDGGVTGVQARLKNLGFDPGLIDGDHGPKTRAAIEAFLAAQGEEEPVGDLTAELCDALEKAQGC
jgi:N-acetylmuramoyl-L-alanine amidase